MKHHTFLNGEAVPAIGLGTWKAPAGEMASIIENAIEAGYRSFDCAYIYGNEPEIGTAFQKAIKSRIVSREELFITSKLWNNSHQKEDVLPALKATLSDLQVDYLDLYLIHWPVATQKVAIHPKVASDYLSLNEVPILETWEQLIEAKKLGLVKHIGVSNFGISNLTHLIQNSAFAPEMNQVEAHPYLNQKELLHFCQKNNILFTAYAPLGARDKSKPEKADLFEIELLQQLSKQENCSIAQLLLAWGMQRGSIVIPKTSNAERMKENIAATSIQLSNASIQEIDSLNKNHRFINGSFWIVEGNGYTLEELWA